VFCTQTSRRRDALPRLARATAILFAWFFLPSEGAAAQQPNQAAAAPAAAAQLPDVLRPGDAVRLRVWREPDLSGDFVIDASGIVTLPKVGRFEATSEPVDSLKARLLTAYQRYLKQPSIEVIPLRRIQVAGAVRTPGLYTVDPTMTIADIVALAGGVTPQGRHDRVVLRRGAVTVASRVSADGGPLRAPLRSGDEVFVPERRLISRSPGVVVGAVSATASMIWAISRLRQ
jgi:polysaccharide export outer membrane protein